MQTPITLKAIIDQINICNSWGYIGFAILLSLIIRLFLCVFKAKALIKGEADTNGNALKGENFGKIFRQSFFSNSGDVKIDDHWLPFFMGLIELILFPFFMAQGYWTVIIGWIGLKALGSWGGQNTRTAYNRFLFGNIITLIASVVLAITFFI